MVMCNCENGDCDYCKLQDTLKDNEKLCAELEEERKQRNKYTIEFYESQRMLETVKAELRDSRAVVVEKDKEIKKWKKENASLMVRIEAPL
jgi:hypothetical protein